MRDPRKGLSRFRIHRTMNLAEVNRLHALTFPGDEFYEHRGNHYWLVRDNALREHVGFCIATVWSGGILFLSRAGLVRSARGFGLHRRLIRVRERFGRETGMGTVVTYVRSSNPGSFVSLIKCGYSVYDPEYAYGTADALYFMKPL